MALFLPTSSFPSAYNLSRRNFNTTPSCIMPPKRKASQQDTILRRSLRKLPDKVYTYETLLPGEIRILILSPGQPNDPLRGTLETVSLHDDPEYKAISYAWGKPVFPEQIHLSRGILRITTCLYGALRRIRSETEAVRLWADAICINQHGYLEKNHLVDIMGDIYCRAKKVLVWLGEAEPADCLAFWTLNVLNDFARPRLSVDGRDFNSLKSGELPQFFEKYKFTSDSLIQCPLCGSQPLQEDQPLEAALSALATVWRRSWFGRLWVLQEVSLATSVSFLFGDHGAPKQSIEHAIAVHHSVVFDRKKIVSCLLGEREALEHAYKTFYGMFQINQFLDLLVETSRYSSSEPRDCVFAIRALAGVQQVEGLTPDYDAPLLDIWIRTTKYILSSPSAWETEDVSFYCPCPSLTMALPATDGSRMSPAQPSWVPD